MRCLKVCMPPENRHHVSLSAIAALIEPARIELLLAHFIPDPAERAFVARCIVDIGPAHHRGANYVLLALLGQLLELRAPKIDPCEQGETVAVPIRLPPPQLMAMEARTYPLRMSIAALQRLAEGDSHRLAAMVDCLLDGPPQHTLANVAMVNVLGVLLERSEPPAK